jgi:Peptidase M50B-like
MASWRTVHALAVLWDKVASAQPAPPRLLVAATAVVALVLVLPYRPWRLARHVITIAHEGGHALVALLTGRRLAGIRLHSDTSGLTVSSGRPSGPGMVLTLLAGYVTPSLLGLAWAAVLATGRITLLLWTSLVVLALMLVMIRNAFGVVSVVVTGAVVFAVSWYASPAVQAAFAYLAVWFLLAGGVRPVFELQRLRRRGRMRDSDADQVARLTRVPALAWVGAFLVVNVLALLAGAALTLHGAGITLPHVQAPPG